MAILAYLDIRFNIFFFPYSMPPVSTSIIFIPSEPGMINAVTRSTRLFIRDSDPFPNETVKKADLPTFGCQLWQRLE